MASADDATLLWTRPEPGARRPKFTRDQIAATALRIADTEGFAAVSMRRIAAELGAGTMTLYYYVRTKDELVALMDDALMGQVLIPADELPGHWHEALTLLATRTWEALMRHPWSLHALQNVPPGPNALRHFDQSLATLAGTDLDPATKLALLHLVDDYVSGHVLRSAERTAALDEAEGEEVARFVEAEVATGTLPHVRALFGGTSPRRTMPRLLGGTSERERFADGLSVLLDGVAARLGLDLPAR